ncbi:acyl-[acyl-carrier-protein] thioesterase, partial [Lactococcus lactis]
EVAYGHLIESHFQINEKTVDEAGEAVPLQTIHEIKIGEDTYCEAIFTWREK